ncbi:MAG: hypothetical protein K6D38_09755 [Pseudobutyrivibrio sp.]|nr:hypothetical protein [Pseudobutyrivibrio sp.]
MEKHLITATKQGAGFNNSNVAYSAIGISDVAEANEQVRNMYDAEDAVVFFTCANVAAARIRDKRHLYETFSRDELDALLFYCMDEYQKLKEKRPYDGSLPFEVYVTKFVLSTGRQSYARSKESDYDHLVSTVKNKSGDISYYGSNGKMVTFTSVDDEETNLSENSYDDLHSVGFEEAIIDKIDAEEEYVNEKLIDKLENAHPLLKIVFKIWALDCKNGFIPFYKYLSDERVLDEAIKDESCTKYVLEHETGEKYINPSTASRMLYKFQEALTQEDVYEILRLGTDMTENPYIKAMLG